MRLYHYSNADIPDQIKISYFGTNSYTSNDKRVASIDRSFFYLEHGGIPEHRFRSCQFKYAVDVDLADLYDITKDPLKLLDEYATGELLYQIKKRGYKGAIYNVGFDIVIYFHDIKPIEKVDRRAEVLA